MTLPDRLPSVTGAGGAAARTLYWLVLAATAAALAGSVWFGVRAQFGATPAAVAFGFRIYADGGGIIVGERTPKAVAAGLADGDRIVAVAGVALPSGATTLEVGERLRGAPARTTVTVDRDGARRTATIMRGSRGWSETEPWSRGPIWLYAALTFATGVIFPLLMIAAAAALAWRRPRDPEALLLGSAFLLLCWSPNSQSWLEELAGWPDRLLLGIANLGWAGLYAGIAGFPDGRFATRTARTAALGAALLALGDVAVQLHQVKAIGRVWSVCAALVFVAAALALALRYRGLASGSVERQQIKWAMFGFGVACLATLFFLPLQESGAIDRGGPGYFLIATLMPPLIFSAPPLGLLVSLLRYRLYDAESAISRSASYAVLTVALLAVFTGTEKLVELLGQDYLGNGAGALVGGIGAAVMVPPLHARAVAWADRRFRSHLIALRKGLPALVDDLRETVALADLARAVVERVTRDLRARTARLVVAGEVIASTGAEDVRWAARVPLTADAVPEQGVLLVGPRPDGSPFGRDEREALDAVAAPVARAIAVVAHREAERAVLHARIARLEGLVAGLVCDLPLAGR